MTTTQVPSLAFLAQQCRRRLRSQLAVDEHVTDNNDIPDSRKTQSSNNPFAAWPISDADQNGEGDRLGLKLDAWRHGFCGVAGGVSGKPIGSPLALLLRLRTPTSAFRLLAAAERRSPRPLSATISVTFISAAEGLYGALATEATAAWRAVVGTQGSDDDGAAAGTSGSLANYSGARALGVKRAEIETVIAGLVNCWRLQRVAARCASLVGRLMLERAVSEVKQDPADGGAAAGLAYTRACSWLLVSGDSLVESFTRLQDAADRMSAIEGEVERTAAVSSLTSVDDDDEGNRDLTAAGFPSPDLEHFLPRAMYESFLLPCLGVGDTPESRPPAVTADVPASSDRNGNPFSLDDVLARLVSYLHGEDMRWLSQTHGLRVAWDGVRRSTLLSKAVVYGDRIPWTRCSSALSQALLALDEQDKRLAENTSSNISSSSGSSSASLSGMKTSPRDSKRQRPERRTRRDRVESTEHPRRASLEKRDLAQDRSRERAEGGSATPPPHEWVVVARAILMGYSEQMEARDAPAGYFEHPAVPVIKSSALAADPRILQLACERHPHLVAPAKIGVGPLGRDLLAGGKTQPVVAALVRLTLCGGSQGAGETCSFRRGGQDA